MSEPVVRPGLDLVGTSAQALVSAGVTSIEGTFSGCMARSGRWSLGVVSGATLRSPPLTVVERDARCELAIDALAGERIYRASPALKLAGAFPASPSAFTAEGDAAPSYYGKAKLSATDFAAGVRIVLAYADSSLVDELPAPVSSATVGGAASASTVPTPDYGVQLGALRIVDDGVAIREASGYIGFVENEVPGERLVIVKGSVGEGAAEAASAFAAGTARSMDELRYRRHRLGPSVDASMLELVDSPVPAVRTLVIEHAEARVASYQVVRLAF